MVGVNTGAGSQSVSQHDHEKETCMETAVSDTVTTVRGWFSGQLGRLRPELSSQIVGNWGFARRQTQLNEVNSTQRCRSNPRLPGSARKRVGAWVWVQGWGAGTRGQGPRGMGMSRDRGALEARRFPVRVCQCRGAAPPPSSLGPGARAQGAVQSFPFPQAGLLHS